LSAKTYKKQADKPKLYEKNLVILADFEQSYQLNGERITIFGKKGDNFTIPELWQRDGDFFVLPNEARVRLPIKDE
jgi:hypothetical protein